MRIFMAALLAGATIATPATAQDTRAERAQQRQLAREGMRQAFGGDREARQERRAERQEFRQNRQGDRQEFRRERRDDFRDFRQERREDREEFRQERREDRQGLREGDVTRREFRRDRADDIRDFRRDRAQDTRDFRRDRLQDGRDFRRERWDDRRDRWDDRRDWQRNGNGNWGWNGNRWGWNDRNGGGWNRDWRRDRRFDWQGWRQQNRNVFQSRRYFAPPGWGFGYRRFSLGVILSAPLFAQNYWLDDPWQYRLPPAYGPYRWVRYWDDVMLVDIRDGRVVDVVYDFFW